MTAMGPVSFNADAAGRVVPVTDKWQGGKQVLDWPKDQMVAPVADPVKPYDERWTTQGRAWSGWRGKRRWLGVRLGHR
jgi:hypothetical protein